MKNFTVLFLLLISLVVFGQDKDKKTDTKPVELKVNLLISDSKNIIVDDIKQEDLRLFEDGIEQKISSFEKLSSANVGIVVDNTGSVRKQLDIIIATVNNLIENLPENTEAFVVRFVNSDKISIMQNWTKNKSDLKNAVSDLYVEGGASAVFDAVFLSAEKFSEKRNANLPRNIMILISDCEDLDSFYNQEPVFEILRKNRVEVCIVRIQSELGRQPIEKVEAFGNKIVKQTNGLMLSPKYSTKDYEEIKKALGTILDEIQMPYRIGYISTNQKLSDSERKITVEITNDSKGEKRRVFVRDKTQIPK